MVLHCAFSQMQRRRNFTIAAALTQQLQNLDLSRVKYWSLDKVIGAKRSAIDTDRSVGEAEKALPNSVRPWKVSLT